jgi:uncharacterized delta-60 repeat protein
MIHTRTQAPARQRRTAADARGMLESLETRVLFAGGDLDSTFGSGGYAVADFRNASVTGIDVATFGDKTYAAGIYTAPGAAQSRIALAAFDRAGRADPSLGGDGTVVTDVVAMAAYQPFGEMAVQPDGKIVVVTALRYGPPAVSPEFTVARFNPNGSTDTTFGGGDGHVEFPFGKDIALAPGGKVVVSGTSTEGRFAVARLNPNGSLDTTFDGDGVRNLDFGSHNDSGQVGAEDVAVMSDGRIILVGAEQTLDEEGVAWFGAVARLKPDGSYDNTFAGDGTSLYDFGYMDNGLTAAAVGPNGEVLVGTMEGEIDARPRVITGSDALPATTTFSKITWSNIEINRMHVTADGKVIVAGNVDETTLLDEGPDTFLARYNADGTLDRTFAGGHATRVTSDRSALTPEGDVMTLISPRFQPVGTFGVARYLGSDTNDRTTVTQPEGAPHSKLGVVAAKDVGGYTGTGYADFLKDSGASLSAQFVTHQGGNHELVFRYANGSHRARTLELEVRGVSSNTYRVTFLPTGSWTRWREARITVPINPRTPVLGEYTPFVLRSIGQNGPNIDKITVTRPPVPQPSTGLIQAEDGLVVGADVFSVNPGYTGRGYVDYRNPSGDYAEWYVSSPTDRFAQVTFRYANGGATARPLELRENGGRLNEALSFAPTGSWSTWKELTVQVFLGQGTNTIRLTSTGSNGPNLDSLTIS